MRTADFDYDLPSELIAQEPARPRDTSRLLVLHRDRGEIEHRQFRDVLSFLRNDDLVVLNDTKVIRARLYGRRQPGGGKAEVLLLSPTENGLWEALATPGRRLQPGREIVFGDGELTAEVVARTPAGGRLLRFSEVDDLGAALARVGEMPTPPYIHQALESESDYQTVYAREPGASAAPTAGLHFTPELLEELTARVRAVVTVTLHVGLGTFRPIHTERIEDHQMHSERYFISEAAAAEINSALRDRRRVLAVGTSTARALEAAVASGTVRAGAEETDLFICPGYAFSVVGGLLTNFHMPRSTLLALVSAFAGRENILKAYHEAIERKYRFLSFGDA
ncbi:MAG: tRNA preQ1(34) S-adenosylmethionine ribosyltransferase-isomerase QueA, partial [Armatimonadetes bacterium]|nr:tRNA preQ1(34) S-adenosylmethionine ribosyltransferase-isomerase QueA [Armatimonadota bacterium]